ncbi:MAG: alginate export family protein, partial [Verrucomicrobiae bacterium]|nr:alginate export family protein [Verrucomicrobiae bacterium]
MVAALFFAAGLAADAADSAHTPPTPYKTVRYDEDYRYLSDAAKRSDFLDKVKYLPLDAEGDWYASFGGEVRQRYEYFENYNWGLGPQDSTGYLLQRYLLSGDLHYRDSFRVFGQFMSAPEEGRAGGPRPTDREIGDLHQGFLDAKFGLDGQSTLTIRPGRQEMYYGSQRLVSVREAPNIRLSFDGLRMLYRRENLQLDAFVTKPVKSRPGYFDDEPNPDSTFWGVYGVAPWPLLPGGHADFYYLGFENDTAAYNQGAGREVRHSIGTRVWGKASGWDYNVELVYQFGSFGDGRLSAWTAASETGYTFAHLPLQPRFSFKADIASGDRNPGDSKLQTFNALFPKGAYFSETGLVGPANLVDVHPGIELKLTPRLTFFGDWDFFWRQTAGDGLYSNALRLVRAGDQTDARYIGSQVQAMLQWNISKHFAATVVYAHFFAGEFLKETPPGNDVNYASAWLTF